MYLSGLWISAIIKCEYLGKSRSIFGILQRNIFHDGQKKNLLCVSKTCVVDIHMMCHAIIGMK